MSLIRTFFWSFVVTIVGLAAALYFGSFEIFLTVAILSALEISFSFDNAVINATILRRMSKFWQNVFLTVGMLIAVFGMRLLFPFLLVSASAHISVWESVDLAMGSVAERAEFQHLLVDAHPAIAAFGGVFLLMIFLDFVFEDRDLKWLRWLERPLVKIGKLDQLSVVIALTAITLAAQFLAGEGHRLQTLLAGVLGLLTYLLVNGLGKLFDVDEHETDGGPGLVPGRPGAGRAAAKLVGVGGRSAFFLFLYLEVLDASFSFDGVVGAFAVTSYPFVIALGLGIGAMYVRSLTVYLVNSRTVDAYVFLEHGAHWAIGVLALILILTIKLHIPEVVTGLIGIVFIAASLWASIRHNRKTAVADTDLDRGADDLDRELTKV